MSLITIETKDIAIQYIRTTKLIVVSFIKPIPRDTFKEHMLSLGVYKV